MFNRILISFILFIGFLPAYARKVRGISSSKVDAKGGIEGAGGSLKIFGILLLLYIAAGIYVFIKERLDE